jgi:hypothetical protein
MAWRGSVARVSVALGVLCGIFGLLAGLLDRVWKLSPAGWFTGGSLLTLLAIFVLVDGALAANQSRRVS